MPFDTNQGAYVDLRDVVAERTKPILAWVGSGLSVAAGLPTWPQLRTDLIEALRNKAESMPGERKHLLGVAERAAKEHNPWVAFEILNTALGKTTFRDAIRRSLAPSVDADTPIAYEDLWNLRIKGILTLNLDRLATRSMTQAFPTVTPIELSGTAVERLRTHLAGPRPLVANLHGIVEDTETWVLTQSQLSSLLRRSTYTSFIDTCASMFTIIFVGLSVDDIAVGGHLERLTKRGVEFQTAFWITDRREFNVDKWAESVGIRVIRYSAPKGDHAELREVFQDLRNYVPKDQSPAPPVHIISSPNGSDRSALPAEQDLLGWSAEDLRVALNAHAGELLADETEEAYAAYDQFSREYDQAIYRAWYTSDTPGKNQLLGYTLEKYVARGAFGAVYRALSPDGKQVAVKVLLDEVRRDAQALQSFRRGVRSMKYLERAELPGIVAYQAGSEIPAFVAMDWVEGPNLAEAKQSRQLENWAAIVSIALQLVRTIRSSHSLPERVLHRDIRPENIMLRDFWMNPEPLDVVVLDFDLSWHVGAQEKSVLHTTAVGYLAPEQMELGNRSSTRSAFVDSFGIGMTLYFLCGGHEPVAAQHRHTDWASDVKSACESLPSSDWRSLPSRFERLIRRATVDEQSARLDLAEMEHELALMEDALDGRGRGVGDVEVVSEELAARVEAMIGYVWDVDTAEAVRDLGTGLRVSLRADVVNDEVVMEIAYASQGGEDRAALNRFLDELVTTLKTQFMNAGWTVSRSDHGYADMTFEARIGLSKVRKAISASAKRLDEILARVRFDRVR